MQFNLLICDDNDKQLLNETVSSEDEVKIMLDNFMYAYEARMDNLTGGSDE